MGSRKLSDMEAVTYLQREVLYSFFIHSKAFTAQLLKGDVMTNHDFIEELAGLLAMESQEAHALLNSFLGAMVAEFLACGKLSVKGLGRFSVRKLAPVKKITVSGTVYTPPCNRMIFERGSFGGDDTVRIAVSRVSMSPDDANRFGRTLAKVLVRAFKEKRELVFNGFGRFTLQEGGYGFVAESTLEALLNREYQDLEEVVVLPQDRVPTGSRRKAAPFLILVSAAIAAGVLLVFLYGRQFAESIPFSVATFSQRSASVSPNSNPPVSSETVTPAQGGGADSLVLEKEDYTIILATFRSGSTARKEISPLRSKGITAFVWPAFSGAVKYHRVTTGRFSGREEASAHLKRLPEKTAGSAYIQHVIKRVVLHAEKEL